MTRLLISIAMAVGLLAPTAVPATESGMRLALGYDGRLLVKVLDVEVDARVDRTGFGAEAQLTSSGILALVKHIHQVASSQGQIVDGEPRPGDFETQNLAGKTRRKVHTVWRDGHVSMDAEPAFDTLGDPPANPQQKLAAADPLTQLMRVALGGSRERTCNRSYMLFDGKQLYALDFGTATDVPLGPHEQRLGLSGGFRCEVRYREVAGFRKKPASKRNEGLKHPIELEFARLGADGPLLITHLSADTPLGKASIELARVSEIGRGSGGGQNTVVAGIARAP